MCPYIFLLDYSSSLLSLESALNKSFNRCQDLSKQVNMSMAITSITYLHHLLRSKYHNSSSGKKRRIIDDDDDDDDKLNVTLMITNTMNLLSNYSNRQDDFLYQVLYSLFNIAMIIGQQQLHHPDLNDIILSIDGLKYSFSKLIANQSQSRHVYIDKFLRDFLLWILSAKGPEPNQLHNILMTKDLFNLFLIMEMSHREKLVIDTVKSFSLVIEDKLKKKVIKSAECQMLVSKAFSSIKQLLPIKLAIQTIASSFMFTFSRAPFRVQSLTEVATYINETSTGDDIEMLIFGRICDVMMLDGTETVRLKSLTVLKDLLDITKINKEVYRVLLLKLRDTSSKVRVECFKLLKSIKINDVCDILLRNELLLALKYIMKLSSLIPIIIDNDEDKQFINNIIKACANTSNNINFNEELQVPTLATIPINMKKNIAFYL